MKRAFGLLAALALVASATGPAFATPGICAFVYFDANCDGEYQEGEESPLEGWEVCITSPSNDEDCRTTDVDGAACWIPLFEGGEYQVCVTLMDGFQATNDPCQFTTVGDFPDGDIMQVFFGVTNEDCPTPTLESSWGSIKSIYR